MSSRLYDVDVENPSRTAGDRLKVEAASKAAASAAALELHRASHGSGDWEVTRVALAKPSVTGVDVLPDADASLEP